MHRRLRNGLLRGAALLAHPGDRPLPALHEARRILLSYVNFRLGNTILATLAVSAIARALPQARIDFLGGPAAPVVLRNFPLDRVFVVHRHVWWNPVRVALLRRRLRPRRYDVAIHLSTSTASVGAFGCRLSGAPERIGCKRPTGNVYFTSTVEAPPLAQHKMERLVQYLHSLGIDAPGGRRVILDPSEQMDAVEYLRGVGLEGHERLVGIFCSGRARKGKKWSLESLAEVARTLREDGLEPIVFLGPEERRRAAAIRAAFPKTVCIAGQDLRRVAALLARCRAVVAPDSGPMHLSIAAGTQTVALFRNADYGRWGPTAEEGNVVYDPAGRDSYQVVLAVRDALGAGANAPPHAGSGIRLFAS